MDSVLIFIDMPESREQGAQERWLRLLAGIGNAVKLQPDIQKIGENCWQIPLNNGASGLAAFVTAANNQTLGHRILFFEKPPEWAPPLKSAS